MTHDYNWTLIGRVPRCHKWFSGIRRSGIRGVAVADESGHFPHETDDGVLWLVGCQWVMVNEKSNKHTHPSLISVDIELEDEQGHRKLLGGTNLEEAIWLHEKMLVTGTLYPPKPWH